jgi:hypothetical protein
MSMRFLPPAYSPVSAGSLAGGLRGLALGSPAGVDQWLARRYDVDATLLLDSGTSALRLAMQSLATGQRPASAWRCRHMAAMTLPPPLLVPVPMSPSTISIPPRWAPSGHP